MSKKLVRLDLNGQDDSMYPHPDGEWVTFAEYEAMRGQLAALVEVASRFVMESERVCSIDTTVPTAHVNALAKVLLEIQADGPTERFYSKSEMEEAASVLADKMVEEDERYERQGSIACAFVFDLYRELTANYTLLVQNHAYAPLEPGRLMIPSTLPTNLLHTIGRNCSQCVTVNYRSR